MGYFKEPLFKSVSLHMFRLFLKLQEPFKKTKVLKPKGQLVLFFFLKSNNIYSKIINKVFKKIAFNSKEVHPHPSKLLAFLFHQMHPHQAVRNESPYITTLMTPKTTLPTS